MIDPWERNRLALRDIHQRASSAFESLRDQPLVARDGHEFVLGVSASWCRYIQYGIAAVRDLHDAGLGHYAAPIRRSLLEHAISIVAIERDSTAFESYVRGLQTTTRRLQDAMRRVGAEAPEGMDEVLSWATDPATSPKDRGLHVKHRFEDFGETGRRLYVSWLQETIMSHATYATAVLYLKDTPDDDWPTLTIDPQVLPNAWESDALCADLFVLALDGLSRMLRNDPLRETVNSLNAHKAELLREARALVDQE